MASRFVRSAAATAEAAALALALVACGSGGSGGEPATVAITPTVHVFDADLGDWQPNNGRWYSYVQSDEACASGVGFETNYLSPASCFAWLTDGAGAQGQWVGSSGPWWIDPNHMTLPGGNGLGFINILAFAQVPAAFRSPADLDDATVSFRARVSSDFSTIEADSAAGRRKGHAYLWFQTSPRPVPNCTADPQIGENCTRQSNYILTGNWSSDYEIDRLAGTAGRDFSFRLSATDSADWTCLGAGINVKYDCMGFAQAIRNVAVIGFVIAPVAPCPTIPDGAGNPTCDRTLVAADPASYFNLGRFEHRSFRIVRNRLRSDSASLLAFEAAAPQAPAVAWDPIRYAPARSFGPGSGLHLVIPADAPALRLGVAVAAASTFDDAGYQIYVSPAGGEPGQPDNALYVVSQGEDESFDRVYSTLPYDDGDNVGLHFDNGKLLFLKNGEVMFTVPSPCGVAPSCTLLPFVATAADDDDGDDPSVYAY